MNRCVICLSLKKYWTNQFFLRQELKKSKVKRGASRGGSWRERRQEGGGGGGVEILFLYAENYDFF